MTPEFYAEYLQIRTRKRKVCYLIMILCTHLYCVLMLYASRVHVVRDAFQFDWWVTDELSQFLPKFLLHVTSRLGLVTRQGCHISLPVHCSLLIPELSQLLSLCKALSL